MVVKNRTARYLYSVFSAESKNFKKYYNGLKRRGLFIGDDVYRQEHEVNHNNHLFVLINTAETDDFDQSLSFFRVYDNYEDDYYVDDNLHMLIFKIDSKFRKTLYHFKRSQYSKMYSRDYLDTHYQISKPYELMYDGHHLTLEDCEKLIESLGSLEKFISEVRVSTYAVLNGSKELRDMYNKIYELKPSDFLTMKDELDSQIDLAEEIYRYSSDLRATQTLESEEASK